MCYYSCYIHLFMFSFFKKTNRQVGIDLVKISRFRGLDNIENSSFLNKVFYENERQYCLSFKDSATHFAGNFACKEAVSKALGVEKFPFSEIEIKHEKSGKPYAVHKGKRLFVEVSITHTDEFAVAIAVT